MSIASELKRCPKCGAPIPAEAPQGLCPKCLLLEISTPTDAGQSHKSIPLTREELVTAFPQLEILELIGQGGMGFVFKARQPKLDRFVALKILPQSLAADPAFAERFTREGRLLARLNHPNIVTVHDFGQANEFFYLLMEYVDGVNLRQAMKAGRFTPEQALAVVPKICEALQFAHNEGILHRDIKPENILLDTRGRVKIADFGIAKLISEASGRERHSVRAESKPATSGAHGETRPTHELTGVGKTLGTPNYMAPEQIKTPGAVDHRADIYSLGVVFYEILTGELPGKQLQPPSSKVQIDVRLDEIVLRALEKKPELRYQQVSEVKTCVENITGSAGVPPAESGVAPDSRKTNLEERAVGATPTAAPETRALSETPPRFSRMAIVGATWAAFFGLMLLLMFMPWTGQITQYRGSAWWREFCTFLFTHGLPMFNPNSPTWRMFTLLPLGLAAPFGTTILGWIAASQIRRSTGKIYGLGLAVFDGLLFPLLLLDGLLCGFFLKMATLLADFYANPSLANNPQVHPSLVTRFANVLAEHRFEIPIIVAGVASIIVDYLIIRRVWRAVNKPLDGAIGSAAARVARPALNRAYIAAVAISLTVGVIGMIALMNYWRSKDSRVGTSVPVTLTQPLSFGPVVERVVTDSEMNRGIGLDLESGEVFNVSKLPLASVKNHFRSKNADIYFDPAKHEWRALDMTPISWNQASLNLSVDDVTRIHWKPFRGSTRIDGFPSCYFQTREGNMGVLQIVDQTVVLPDDQFPFREPHGVKIRYKLVQSAKPKPIIISSDFGPVIERALPDGELKTGYEALDLRTGNFLSGPREQRNNDEFMLAWMETNHVDLVTVWDPDPEDSNRVISCALRPKCAISTTNDGQMRRRRIA